MKENPNKQKYTRVPLPIRVPQELNYSEDEDQNKEEIQSQNNAKKRFFRKFSPQSEF